MQLQTNRAIIFLRGKMALNHESIEEVDDQIERQNGQSDTQQEVVSINNDETGNEPLPDTR